MKIILLQDVPKIGKKYEIKNVSDGFARNFLIVRGLAKVASLENTRAVESLKRIAAENTKKKESLLKENLLKLTSDNMRLAIKANANENGGLFSGLDKTEIAKRINQKTGIEIAAEMILLERPIKQIGEYDVEIAFGKERPKIKIAVERES